MGCQGRENEDQRTYLYVGENRVLVDVARTDSERERGLSGRTAICTDCGMLFVFDAKDFHSFWMKDMNFDIDILWISDSIVVDFAQNLKHKKGTLEQARPSVPIDRALEVPAGFVAEKGVYIGEEIRYSDDVFD